MFVLIVLSVQFFGCYSGFLRGVCRVFVAAYWLSLVVASGGSLAVVPRLLITVASLVAEHGPREQAL